MADGLGRALTYSYDGNHHLTAVSDGLRSITFSYGGHDFPLSFTDARGQVTGYGYYYQPKPWITSITRPRGNVPCIQGYQGDLVSSQIDAYGNRHRLNYETNRTTVTDPLNNTTIHDYDWYGNLVSLTGPDGKSFNMSYDENGRLNSVTDRLADSSSYGYNNSTGELVSTTGAEGGATNFSYTSRSVSSVEFHDLHRVVLPDGTHRSLAYDGVGNLTRHEDRAGHIRTYTYNDRGQMLTATNPLGGVTAYSYNEDGTMDTLTDHSGKVTRFDYDELKRLVKITWADAASRAYSYDENDNLLRTTDELGHVTAFSYDENGNLASSTDARSQVMSFSYDEMDRVVSITDRSALGNKWTYDPLGRPLTQTDRMGHAVTFCYDEQGRLTSFTDGAGKIWRWAHDAEGILASRTDPLGRVTTYGSDKMGRLSSLTSPLGSTSRIHLDSMGRVTALENPLNQVTRLSYDAMGRLSKMTLPGGAIYASYTRNALGQLTGLKDPNGHTWSSTHDLQGRLISQLDPRGNRWTYEYDARSRAGRLGLPGVGSPSLELTYDARGRLTRRRYSDGTELNYQYDELGRLIAAEGVALSYDENSRLTGCNGLSMTRHPGGLLKTLELGPGKVDFTYDGFGNRISRKEGQTTCRYVWNYGLDLPSVNVEREGESDLRYQVTTPGGALLYSLEAQGGARRYYHFDEAGNTRFLTDESGAVLASYAYGPYGELLGGNDAVENPFTWRGRAGVMREGTSLYYMRARYYDSLTARFLSRDPVRSLGPRSANPYQYGLGNPLLYGDPTGRLTYDLTPEESEKVSEILNDLVKKEFLRREKESRKRGMGPPAPITRAEIQRFEELAMQSMRPTSSGAPMRRWRAPSWACASDHPGAKSTGKRSIKSARRLRII